MLDADLSKGATTAGDVCWCDAQEQVCQFVTVLLCFGVCPENLFCTLGCEESVWVWVAQVCVELHRCFRQFLHSPRERSRNVSGANRSLTQSIQNHPPPPTPSKVDTTDPKHGTAWVVHPAGGGRGWDFHCVTRCEYVEHGDYCLKGEDKEAFPALGKRNGRTEEYEQNWELELKTAPEENKKDTELTRGQIWPGLAQSTLWRWCYCSEESSKGFHFLNSNEPHGDEMA